VELDFTADALPHHHPKQSQVRMERLMGIEVETLFTSALGLTSPWVVKHVELNTAKRRIDFEVSCTTKHLSCPHCGATDQGIHDRISKDWRHLDFFQFEAWLHAQVPRVRCKACGKVTQVSVPWAREGSGFTLLFEALALSLCKELPVAHAAAQLRVSAKRLWQRITEYVRTARLKDTMQPVRLIGIDETSIKKGQQYLTVVHDLQAKRLLFATPGRDHQTVAEFVQDLQAHGGQPASIEHVCMDMSAAYAKGVRENLPTSSISYDRFHVVAMASAAMDEVRRNEMREQSDVVRHALGQFTQRGRKALFWAMRRNPQSWSQTQTQAMYTLQRTNLQSARAWRLKMALRAVYAQASSSNDAELTRNTMQAWLSWATRSRLEPFKKLATTIKSHLPGVLRGMLDGRSNAYVEAMNGMLQQAKRAARGFRTVENFISIAYLRMSKLTYLPTTPYEPAIARDDGVVVHQL
jgi:transposase